MDLHNALFPVLALAPTVSAIASPVATTILDTAGCAEVEFVLITGALADPAASFAVELEHGDDPALADATPVEDDHLIGTEAEASFTQADVNTTRRLGYIGIKRYLRATITPAGNAAAAPLAAVWLRAGGRRSPV